LKADGRIVLLGLIMTAAACGDDSLPAATYGARLMADTSVSPSPFNAFSCATCHAVRVAAVDAPLPTAATERHDGPIFPGWNLYDVVHRPSWYGGTISRLLDAINVCIVEYMGGAELTEDDERARAIYEYLVSISPDDPAPAQPLTVVKNVNDLSALAGGADAARGDDIYARACRGCHGTPHTGAGRLGEKSSVIPEDSLTGPVCAPKTGPAPPDPRACARAVVVEKVRHGKFFNIGGLMPLYGAEQISDVEIADVLAYLGL
jgi:thiosulfate dehydrogenase